jgi:hypothetical protein
MNYAAHGITIGMCTAILIGLETDTFPMSLLFGAIIGKYVGAGIRTDRSSVSDDEREDSDLQL